MPVIETARPPVLERVTVCAALVRPVVTLLNASEDAESVSCDEAGEVVVVVEVLPLPPHSAANTRDETRREATRRGHDMKLLEIGFQDQNYSYGR
jgi:hypothetical protein